MKTPKPSKAVALPAGEFEEVEIPIALYREIEADAKERGVSVDQAAQEAVRDYADHLRRQQPVRMLRALVNILNSGDQRKIDFTDSILRFVAES